MVDFFEDDTVFLGDELGDPDSPVENDNYILGNSVSYSANSPS